MPANTLRSDLPIVYVLTVVSKNAAGKLVINGLYIGDDVECFERAAELSLKVNFVMMDREIREGGRIPRSARIQIHVARQ